MYLLYLDESGGVAEKDQNHYVLAGVSAFERQPYFLQKELDDLEFSLFNSRQVVEFHASVMFNGKHAPWDTMPRLRRIEIMRSVYRIIAETKENVCLFAVVMHKASFETLDPIRRTCEEMSGHFEAFLSRLEMSREGEKQRGLLIFDHSRYTQTLHALLTQFRTTGASFGKVTHLADAPLFADSKITRVLQIADFVAYAVFKRYERGDSQFMDLIIKKFDQADGRVHGLVHLVTDYHNCYCPACLSRR